MLFLMMMVGEVQPPPQDMDADCDAWIAGVARGDMQAFEALYRHTKTAVYGFALSILKRPQAAEDVMQDAYVRLFAAAGDYKSQGKPMAWILTIVRNLSLMQLRDAKRTDELPDEDRFDGEAADFTENSVDRLVLHTALTTLSDEERQIVVLHSISGLKHREIGDLLGLPLSTVLSKYRRALAKLEKVIKEGA